jgi:hypothetical protein
MITDKFSCVNNNTDKECIDCLKTNGKLCDELQTLLSIALKKDKTIGDLKALGILDYMPNGFDVFLDDTRMSELDSRFVYDEETDSYSCAENPDIDAATSLSRDELYDSVVTGISSSKWDIDVPGIYIIPAKSKEEN